MVTDNRITPDWIETLAENEIFVFGCRNSGRHFDGASNFALNNFGAVMGQREGRQGQSYAIPTIGGTIGLRDIRKSVMLFTQYAAEHPELHFLVTPVGCGGGCQSEWDIAPMFSNAAKLPNVSLPTGFWNVLKLQNIRRPSIFYRPKTLYEELVAEFKYGVCVWGFNKDGISLVRWGVGGLNRFGCPNSYVDGYIDSDFRVVVPFKSVDDPFHEDYYRLANHNKQNLAGKESIWR